MTGRAEHDDQAVVRAIEQATAARDRLVELRAEQARLTELRDEAIRTLSALGQSYDAIAATAGVSRARVGQIVTDPRRLRAERQSR